MTPERWARVEELTDRALDLSRGERAVFLGRECACDRELRDAVERLLVTLDSAPGFLERPILDPSRIAAELDAPAPMPTIEGWTLLERIGQGGMGEVFRATRDGDGAPVAIKLLLPGGVAPHAMERFALEQQMLARLSHPNIARYLDRGVAGDGRPFLAMEWVDGTPITSWCDDRALDVDARLRVFLEVCEAAAHAHRALVLHRDLKPANILVDARGHPRLLDFGIGKPMDTAGATVTGTDTRPLTVAYAAPEQLSGGAITTAADVHALGVLLYELLAGVHPFRTEGMSALDVERAILEGAPPRPAAATEPPRGAGSVAATAALARARSRGMPTPAALRRRLVGDLDTIVMMALRKEPERRYSSVEALAGDIRRHLDGRPVRARPDTLRYRTRKFVRRNTGGVAIAVVVTLALLASWITAVVQSGRATRAAALATAERDEAVAVRSFLLETYGATGGDDSVGGAETVRQLLDRQTALIGDRYADRPTLAARLNEVMAEAYDRLGEPSLGVVPATRALALRATVQDSQHPDVASATALLGWMLHQSGRSDEAEPHLMRAVALRRSAVRIDTNGLARALNDLGVLYNATERAARAETVLVEALALRRASGGDDHLGVGITANNLAAAYYFQQRIPEAIETQELALRALDRSVGPDHQRSVIALGNLAAFRMVEGNVSAAEADYRTLLARQERLQGPEHPVTLRVMTSLAAALMRREGSTRSAGLAEAEELLEAALAVQLRLPGHGLPFLASTLERLAGVELARGDTIAAAGHARRAITTLTTLHGAADPRVTRIAARYCRIVGNCR